MKSPFKKLRNFAASKHGVKQKASPEGHAAAEKDVEAYIQDILEMKAKYDDLLTHGQGISSSAYDFSRSLEEMATFMMDMFGDIFDGEVGNLFNMLAKVQFEISKLLDLFALHVSRTLVKSVSDMMEEIQVLESEKNKYDIKRKNIDLFQIEKPKAKLKKGKVYQQLKLDEEYIKNRAQSLMQSQCQNLITQATRYHTAQSLLFSKGLVSVNAVEPELKQLIQLRNVDRTLHVDELLDNTENPVAPGRELDGSGRESPTSSPKNDHQAYSTGSSGELKLGKKQAQVSSKSAPLSPSTYLNEEDEVYALPSPSGVRERWAKHMKGPQRISEFGLYTQKEYHSTNIGQSYQPDQDPHHDIKQKFMGNSHASHHVRVSVQRHDDYYDDDDDEDSSKNKRYSHSGPFFPSYANNVKTPSACSMEVRDNTSLLYRSGPVTRSPVCVPNVISSPQISELHKLPLPPAEGMTTPSRSRSPSPIAFSAPLGRKVQVQVAPPKSSPASPLPPPPANVITRSLSIPSSSIHVE